MAIVIYPPTIDWDYMRQRPQNLMFQFARNGHKVFYCNKKQLKNRSLEKIAENLIVVHNFELFKENCLPALRASGAPVIVWCSWALLANILKDIQPDFIIYDCLDEFADWLPYEPEMVSIADLIICTSDYLMKRMAERYPEKKMFLVNNGCDFELFNTDGIFTLPKPSDLPETAGARIGYIGAWAWWVDAVLVNEVCAAFPQHQIVVIGPKLDRYLPLRYPNFVYLGLKPYKQLPGYLAFLDVCIIPFKINATTLATNPIKAYEYLAAGKPVVSTALPEMIKMQPIVRIGDSHDDFIEHIRMALKTQPEDQHLRKEFAEKNSWEKRFIQIEQIISDEFAGFFPNGNFDLSGFKPNDGIFKCYFADANITISSTKPIVNQNLWPVCIGRKKQAVHRYVIKFDISGLSGNIKKAVLAIFIEKCDTADKLKAIEVKKITSTWNEEITTWQVRPNTGAGSVSTVSFYKTSGWLEWDLTLLVQEWAADPDTNFGVALKGTKETLPFLVYGVNRHRGDYFSPKLKVYL